MVKRKEDEIKIRITKEEKSVFKKAADRAWVSLSEWIRSRLRMAADFESRMPDKEIDAFQKQMDTLKKEAAAEKKEGEP